jgi:hypothetical protein
MSEFFSKLNSDDLDGLLIVAAALIFGLAAIAIVGWLKMRKAELAANLKHDMLARGMSADDIEKVLNAGNKPAALVFKAGEHS